MRRLPVTAALICPSCPQRPQAADRQSRTLTPATHSSGPIRGGWRDLYGGGKLWTVPLPLGPFSPPQSAAAWTSATTCRSCRSWRTAPS